MTDLKSRIQKASEFNEEACRAHIKEMSTNVTLSTLSKPNWAVDGVYWENKRLQWLAEALEIAVEALEHADKFFMDNGDHRGTTPHMKVAVPLNKIAALVPKGDHANGT